MGGAAATLTNGAAFSPGGLLGRGVRLDGVNDLVSVPHSAAYAPNAGALSLWFRPDALGRTQGLVSKNSTGLDAGGGFTVLLQADGTLLFQLESATATFSIQSTLTVRALEWSHFAITWGSSGMQLWVNGVLAGSNAYTGGLGTTSGGTGADDALVFGASTQNATDRSLTGASDFFAGAIDEAAMFTRQLTSAELAAVYANGAMGANLDPTASNDSGSVLENALAPISGNVLSNDVDPNGDTLSIFSVSASTTGVGTAIVGVYGVLTLNADGSYSYVVNGAAANVQALRPGQSVTDTFAYVTVDGKGGLSSASLVVTVVGENDAPVVTAEVRTMVEDPANVTLTGNVLTNDRDLDGGAIAVTAVNGSSGAVGAATAGVYGAITIAASGAYSYVLNNASPVVQGLKNGQVVTESFTYTVSDGQGGSSTTTISLTITGKNDGPVAAADVGAATYGAPFVSGSVLTNDRDVDGDALRVDQVRGSAANVGQTLTGNYGTLRLTSDGAYVYTLNTAAAATIALAPGATATDTFSYRVTDGLANSIANLAITVTGANEAPILAAKTRAIAEDTAAALTGSFFAGAADRDPDGGALSLTSVNGVAAAPGTSFSTQYGTLTITANAGATNTYSYVLNNASAVVQGLKANQVVSDAFTFTVSDGQGGSTTSTLTVTITGRNDGPAVTADAATVLAAGPTEVIGNVLANDRDAEGDTLSVDQVRAVATNVGAPVAGTYGVLTLNADGSYAYALNTTAANVLALRAGQVVTESFTYRATDGVATATSSLVVTVIGQNDAPIVSAKTNATVEDSATAVTGAFIVTAAPVSDRDVDGGVLSLSSVAGGATTIGRTISGVYGVLTITGANAYSYRLDNARAATQGLQDGQIGTDVFTFVVSDGQGGLTTSSLTVSVTGANDGPVVTGEVTAFATEDGAPVTLDALANASDPDAASVLSVVGLPVTLPDGVTYDAATRTFTLNPSDPAYQSLSAGDSTVVVVEYAVSDGVVAIPASAVWTITGTNDAPVVTGEVASFAAEDETPVALDALAAASDVDVGDVLSVVDVPANLPAGVDFDATAQIFTLDPRHAAYQSLAAGDTLIVTVDYGVSDGLATTPARATWILTGTNDAPVVTGAVTGAASEDDVLLTLDALAFATDADAGAELIVIDMPADLPAGVTYDAEALAFTLDLNDPAYQALAAGETVIVAVDYGVFDGLATTPARVIWTVTGANDAPVVTGEVTSEATEGGAPVTLDALANASDADAGAALLVVNMPAALPAGVTFDAATRSFRLDPSDAAYQSLAAGATATVTVAYGVSDGVATTPASVSWTVAGANDVPEAQADVATTRQRTPVTINVLGNDTDVDAGDTLSVILIDGQGLQAGDTVLLADGAQATLNANGTITYAPATNAIGPVSFGYTVSDGNGGTSDGTVTVNIEASIGVPVAASISIIASTTAPEFALAPSMPTDSDNDPLSITIVSLPTNGVVRLADGSALGAGAVLDIGAFQSLRFAPGGAASVSELVYDVSDGANTTRASVSLDLRVVSPENNFLTGSETSERIISGVSGDFVQGLGGNDVIFGGDGSDVLLGGDGDDRIEAGASGPGLFDFVDGGDGDDTLLGGTANTALLYGGRGNDFIDGLALYEPASGGVGVKINLSSQAVTIGGETVGPRQAIDEFGDIDSFGANVVNVHGTRFDDVVIGSDQRGYMFLRAGDDIANGGGGNDDFYGGSGADALNGGAGVDRAVYFDDGSDSAGSASAGVIVDLAAGTAIDGWGATDTLISIESVTGSALDDRISGDLLANSLNGGDGADVLSGGAGTDQLFGEGGDDILVLGDDGTGIVGGESYSGGAGFDTLAVVFGDPDPSGARVRNTYGANLSSIESVSFAAPQSGVNVLNTLWFQYGGGISKSAKIVGSDRADQLTIVVAGGVSTFSIADTAFTFENWTQSSTDYGLNDHLLLLGAGIPGVNYELTGSSGIETIVGAAGNDILRGGGGDDVLVGFGGIDQYFGGAGDDAIVIGFGGGPTGENLALETYDGGEGLDTIGAYGTDVDWSGNGMTLTSIEGLGVFGTFTFYPGPPGFSAAPLLGGHLTVDETILSQLPRVGLRIFGSGSFRTTNDELLTQQDRLTLKMSPGTPIDMSSWIFVNWEQQDVVEVIGSSGADQIIGSAYVDELLGEGGDDVVRGGDGDDTLVGGAGRDQLFGDGGDDTLVLGDDEAVQIGGQSYNGGAGFDTLAVVFGDPDPNGARLRNTYGANLSSIESVSFAGTKSGLNAFNILWFQLGGGISKTATIVGSDRADQFSIIVAGGVSTFSLADTAFTLENFSTSDTDYARNDHVSLIGAGGLGVNYVLTGSSGAETISSAEGADILNGGGGDDVLVGFGGIDQYFGGAGDDAIVIGFGGGPTGENLALETYDGGDGADVIGAYGTDTDWSGNGMTLTSIEGLGVFGTYTIYPGPPAYGAAPLLGGHLTVDETILSQLPRVGLRIFGSSSFRTTNDELLTQQDKLTLKMSPGTPIDMSSWIFINWEQQDIVEVIGSSGADQITGSAYVDELLGEGGDDTLAGGEGNDTIDGGDGIDTAVFSGVSSEYEVSVDGAVTTVRHIGGTQADGVDTLVNVETLQFATAPPAMASAALVLPQPQDFATPASPDAAGEPAIQASFAMGVSADGANALFQNYAADLAAGDANGALDAFVNDLAPIPGATLTGGAGADALIGSNGVEVLLGGGGDDLVLGADRFVFALASDGGGTTSDFTSGLDKMEFSAAGFGGSLIPGATGALVSSATSVGAGAVGTQLHHSVTGQLHWDSDGMGATDPVLLATLSPAPTLTQDDVIIGP